MTNDGFMTKVLWPAAKSVDASSLDLVEEGSRVTLAQAVRLQVRAAGTAGAAREVTVAIAEFESTTDGGDDDVRAGAGRRRPR